MPDEHTRQIHAAFEEYERGVTVYNFKVACILGIVLMPFGILLDWFVYPQHLVEFALIRCACSFLILLFLIIMLKPGGQRRYKLWGLILLSLPTLSIAYMIYRTEGAASPYYAGLNLVVLVLGFVLHWTFRESLVAVGMVLIMYLGACLGHGDYRQTGMFFNNMYFLSLTGVIIVTGSYFLSELRFKEFANRYELDLSRKQLEENNRKLLELDENKSRFFANISHELRTPLTIMLGALEEVLQHPEVSGDPNLRQTLTLMRANGLRLLKLINDLLELVRLDAGTLPVKRDAVDLPAFLEGLAAAARHLAERRNLQLVTVVEPELQRVLVDRDKLEKILLNLQFNALKFTPTGGRVELLARRENRDLVLQVRDTGVGIAEKDLPNVFSRFWQADMSSQRKFKGAGIGLALVKELTEVQGGSVAVESRLGQGTTFTVRLPFLPATESSLAAADTGGRHPQEPKAEEWLGNLNRQAELSSLNHVSDSENAPAPVAEGSQPLLLVADDEPDLREFLRRQLSPHYRVAEAVDGRQAVEMALRLQPDLLLLDFMMPEKDGLQVCRELRENPATRILPIIFLTAHGDHQTRLDALRDGATDFLAKPFSLTELHLRVKNLLAGHLYARELARQKAQLEAAYRQLQEAEAQLVQSEKLAALGRMSAGIIHEINNPLNYARTGLYTLRQRLAGLPPETRAAWQTLLTEIEDGINRVKNIVLDLGPFAHERDTVSDETSLRQCVELALRFLSHEWRGTVEMTVDVPEKLTAWANRVRLVQVLVNLLQNSLDALRSQTPPPQAPHIQVRGWQEGGRVFLSVRDNGPGIPPELQNRVFEPFFSTKEIGAGLGLGLHICHQIMHQHGGRIRLQSEPGQYCEFILELPARDPRLNHSPPSPTHDLTPDHA
ncbi:MAG: ATP-binding protein [Verrucomicrobiae bacterium]|nr:ATP-binding protein [Verrucomicrobiae bacterium]